ncbi:MAG: hypothetical protein LLG97_20900 [Deltaproteobacteria bacterium]|nr:hypothetical protein [Deltaproteobacteria bacterium]
MSADAMNEKIMTAGETKDGFIMEFRELLDGNFMMILNGNKLRESVGSGGSYIDLNSPITGGELSPLAVLLLHKMKTFMRGELPEATKKEILELDGDAKRINSFVKKYGFEAIEVPAVRNFFRELVKKARDKDCNESAECKKRLDRLIVAMSHTDRKVRIIRDVSIPDLVRYLEEIEHEADRFYLSVKKFCRDCGGKESSYSKCEERAGCTHLLDHLKEHLRGWSRKRIDGYLKFNTRSEYVEDKFMKKLGVDRTRAEELLRYAKEIKKLS